MTLPSIDSCMLQPAAATSSSSHLTHVCKRRPGQIPKKASESLLTANRHLAVWHVWRSGRSTFRHGAGQTDRASDY